MYTEKEVLQFTEEEDVRFIRLAFCDVFGNQKNVAVMSGELERAFRDGISFDASGMQAAPTFSCFPTRRPSRCFRGGRQTARSCGCTAT